MSSSYKTSLSILVQACTTESCSIGEVPTDLWCQGFIPDLTSMKFGEMSPINWGNSHPFVKSAITLSDPHMFIPDTSEMKVGYIAEDQEVEVDSNGCCEFTAHPARFYLGKRHFIALDDSVFDTKIKLRLVVQFKITNPVRLIDVQPPVVDTHEPFN